MEEDDPQTFEFKCIQCEKRYKTNSNLFRHVRLKHKESTKFLTSKRSLHCPMCDGECVSRIDVEKHLKCAHDVAVQYERREFDTLDEVYAYKADVELRTDARYVKHTGHHYGSQGKRCSIYYCNRAGFFRSKSRGLRPQRSRTPTKTNTFCPAHIKITESEDKFAVLFCSTHVGHDFDHNKSGFLSLHEATDIAAKLRRNVPVEAVFNDIRESLQAEQDRHILADQRDILSITSQYDTASSGVLNSSDMVSLDMWLDDLIALEDSPVVLYKRPDQTCEEFPQLDPKDFLLVLMSEYQLEVMNKFGKDIVALDYNPGANAHGIHLTTLMVIDRRREGFPACYIASNRHDAVSLSVAFVSIKRKCPSLKPCVLMTDDDRVFPRSWCLVFGQQRRRLLSTWNVDKRLRQKVTQLVDGPEEQANAYKLLRTLIVENEALDFQSKLRNAIEYFDEKGQFRRFGQHFAVHYGQRYDLWAHAYRRRRNDKGLEKIHRVLEYIFEEGEMAKRIDEAVHCLMWLVKDKYLGRPVHKGLTAAKMPLIREAHKESLELPDQDIFKTSLSWLINSNHRLGESHSVTRQPACQDNCGFLCKECGYCLHSFRCTCVDSVIRLNMCKHIHAVCRRLKGCPEEVDSCSMMAAGEGGACAEDRDVVITLQLDQPPEDVDQSPKQEVLDLRAEVGKLCADLGETVNDFGKVATVEELGDMKELLGRTISSIKEYKEASMAGRSISVQVVPDTYCEAVSAIATSRNASPNKRVKVSELGGHQVVAPSGEGGKNVACWLLYS